MRFFGVVFCGTMIGVAGVAFAADTPKLATKSYVDGMYEAVDAAKANAQQRDKEAVVVTGTDGKITTASTIDLTKIAVPESCINDAALCVIAFKDGAWTIVDVTPDSENKSGES